ncbi:hypothetical protein CALCODRAFT_367485 [Calocera cornea HHB12733]|uniref:Uncharacterized protein n=1 Tax=Calocera cornea HHB12733 TaxID=1353952 RepID=A0A165JAP6_9BASI|nr:hypothetical protein CALCODRAFT_367485 [Calocera cornea HHB12733]
MTEALILISQLSAIPCRAYSQLSKARTWSTCKSAWHPRPHPQPGPQGFKNRARRFTGNCLRRGARWGTLKACSRGSGRGRDWMMWGLEDIMISDQWTRDELNAGRSGARRLPRCVMRCSAEDEALAHLVVGGMSNYLTAQGTLALQCASVPVN